MVGNVNRVVGINGDGCVPSHIPCCVNGDVVPIARVGAPARAGGILEVATVVCGVVGNVYAIVGVDGNGRVPSRTTWCVDHRDGPSTGFIRRILEVEICIIKIRNVLVAIRINGDGRVMPNIANRRDRARWNRTA